MDRQATARPTIRYLITNNCEALPRLLPVRRSDGLAVSSAMLPALSLTSLARALVQKVRLDCPLRSPASRRNPESLQGCPHRKLFNSLTF
jgi:hypothetical protein